MSLLEVLFPESPCRKDDLTRQRTTIPVICVAPLITKPVRTCEGRERSSGDDDVSAASGLVSRPRRAAARPKQRRRGTIAVWLPRLHRRRALLVGRWPHEREARAARCRGGRCDVRCDWHLQLRLDVRLLLANGRLVALHDAGAVKVRRAEGADTSRPAAARRPSAAGSCSTTHAATATAAAVRRVPRSGRHRRLACSSVAGARALAPRGAVVPVDDRGPKGDAHTAAAARDGRCRRRAGPGRHGHATRGAKRRARDRCRRRQGARPAVQPRELHSWRCANRHPGPCALGNGAHRRRLARRGARLHRQRVEAVKEARQRRCAVLLSSRGGGAAARRRSCHALSG